jgi:hypothetical protein
MKVGNFRTLVTRISRCRLWSPTECLLDKAPCPRLARLSKWHKHYRRANASLRYRGNPQLGHCIYPEDPFVDPALLASKFLAKLRLIPASHGDSCAVRI